MKVHKLELPLRHIRHATVRDLIVVLNEKLHTLTQGPNVLREVTSILLYGTPASDDRASFQIWGPAVRVLLQ